MRWANVWSCRLLKGAVPEEKRVTGIPASSQRDIIHKAGQRSIGIHTIAKPDLRWHLWKDCERAGNSSDILPQSNSPKMNWVTRGFQCGRCFRNSPVSHQFIHFKYLGAFLFCSCLLEKHHSVIGLKLIKMHIRCFFFCLIYLP